MPDVAEAPVAAPAAPAVPAATPSSTPAAPSSPAAGTSSGSSPESTASPSGAPAASETLKADDFNSLEDFAQALIDQRQAKTSADTPPATDAPAVEVPTETPADGAQPPDAIVPDGEQPAVATEVVPELKLEDLQKPLEGEVTLEGIPTVQDLYDKISADPALNEALHKAGARDLIFDTVRKLDHVAKSATMEVNQYRELAPTVDDARYQRDQAVNFMTLDSAFVAADTPQGVDGFLSAWRDMAIIVDEKGVPVPQLDANGQMIPDGRGGYRPQLHNSYFRTFDRITEQKLKAMEKYANPDDVELHAALGVIRERMSPPSPAVDDLPEEQQKLIKSQQASLKQREDALSRKQAEEQQQAATRFNAEVGDDSTKSINSLIEPALQKAQLTGLALEGARTKIDNAIVASLDKNRFFKARMAELAMAPLTAATKQQRVNLIQSHVQSIAGPIIRQVLATAAAPVLEKKAAIEKTAAKVAQQVVATRSEPRSTTGAVPQVAKMSPEKQFDQIRAKYAAENGGEQPDDQKMIELWTLARRSA